MKRLGFTFMALVIALGSFASADVKTHNETHSASTIWIEGDVNVEWFYQSGEINALLGGAGPGIQSESATRIDYAIRLTADLSDRVTGFLELGNMEITGGTYGIGDEIGDGGIAVGLLRGWIQVEEFLSDHLTMKTGVQDYDNKLRQSRDSGAMFLDLRGSEVAGSAAAISAAMPVAASGGAVPNYSAGGWKLTWVDNPADPRAVVDAFTFTSAYAVPDADEHVYGVNLDYNINDDSLLNLIYAAIAMDDGNDTIHTFGLGVDYWWDKNWETYGEVYYQTGDLDVGAMDVDQDAWQLRVGFRYEHDSEYKPYIDVSYWFISGDSDTDSTGDIDSENFVSYETVADARIIEGELYGWDIDTNYWALKFKAGATFDTGHGDLDFDVFFGIFENDESFGMDEELGNELDVTFTWHHSKSLSFSAGGAWVFSADAVDDVTGEKDAQLYSVSANLMF